LPKLCNTTKMRPPFFAAAIYLFASVFCEPQCLDESGRPVDWYVIYKLPRPQFWKKTSNTLMNEGVAYMYFTADDEQWTLSKLSIEDEV
jgi:hypothetical protein